MNFKRIISLFLCLIMLATCLIPLTACGGGKECKHIDADGNGKCDKCDKAVTIKCDVHVDADKNNKCDNCGQTVNTAPDGKTNYIVSVKTLGGMALEGVTLVIYGPDGGMVNFGQTDDKGLASFELDTKSGYTIRLDGVPDGYSVRSGDTPENRYPMDANGAQITLTSAPISEGGFKSKYTLGDVMYDFTLKDSTGKSYKLSDILKDKQTVMLNYWYTTCSWCVEEFPAVNSAYKNYSDKIEILAINDYPSDSAADVRNFPTTGYFEGEDKNLVFPFFKIGNDASDITLTKFDIPAEQRGYPTTVIIDRYGVVTMMHSGAIVDEGKWEKIFSHFTAEKYEQKLVDDPSILTPKEKPDIDWGGSDGIAANLNGSSDLVIEYKPDTNEYSWPFIPATVEGVNVVKPSNTAHGSFSILYADIQLKPGQAIMFDYFSSCEYSSDRLVVIVDKNDICSLTGENVGNITDNEDWEQCCAFVDPRPITETNKDDIVTYEVAFTYVKDDSGKAGDDTVYIKNLRIIDVDDIKTEACIIRDAVSDPTDDKSGFNTYVNYVLGADNYYHVGTADGPLLLANLLGFTNFDSVKTVSQRVMNEGELIINNVDRYNDWMVYANASSNATINGFTPVTPDLKEILDAYCNMYKNEVGKDSHEDLWLQLCVYYDVYGYDKDGNPTKHVEDPIKGLTTFSAFETDFKENPEIGDIATFTVTYDRPIMPRGLLYRFVPKTSGVYRINSHSQKEVHGWIFAGNSYDWMASGTQERIVLTDFEQEERYCPDLLVDTGNGNFVQDTNNVSLVAYMEADKEYFIDIAYSDLYEFSSFTFDIKYEGEAFSSFTMASPGPITYIENASGGMGQLIAIGIDYGFKVDPEDGISYAYQVLARDEKGVPTVWGEKIYADFSFPTIPITNTSIANLVNSGNKDLFNFTYSEYDEVAIKLVADIRNVGKEAIIAKWTADGEANAADLWATKNLDTILELVQKGEDVSTYPAEDVATAKEALEIGRYELKKSWGIEALGDVAEDWDNYDMDNVLKNGIYSADQETRAIQEEVMATIQLLWKDTYEIEDVEKGIYHGGGTNAYDDFKKYVDLMDDGSERVERQGCVAVTEELAELLGLLYSKYNFENVKHAWLKFCFYYKYLGA